MTAPLTDEYLAKAERDARRFQGVRTGTIGTLAAHVMRLLGEVKRLKTPPVPLLVSAINRQTAAMLAGGLPARDRFLYTAQDPYGKRFTRNPTCWLAGVANVTCFSPAQLSGTPWNQRGGTLITRRHIVYANHFGIPIIEGGTPILFVHRDGTVVERKVVAQAADAASDIAIGLLDADVPDGIAVAPVLPADYERHLGARNAVLAVAIDAEEKANVLVCDTFFDRNFSCSALDANWMPQEFKRIAAWGEATIVGDSGNPVFVIIGNELVLLGCWRTAMGGPHLGARHELVNGLIDRLSPSQGYRLTVSRAAG